MSTISRISSAPCGQTHCGPQIYPISRPRTALPSLFSFLVVADFDVDSLYQLPLLLTAGVPRPLRLWQCFFVSKGDRSIDQRKFSLTFFFLRGSKLFLDIWGNVGPCSFLFFLRFLWRCQPSHRAHLFSSTRICVAQRTGFLAPSHQISSPTHSYFLHF